MLQAIRTWGVRQMAPSRAAEGSTPSSIFIEVRTISCLKVLQMTRGTARLLKCDAVLERGKKPVIAMPKQMWTTAGGKAQNMWHAGDKSNVGLCLPVNCVLENPSPCP